MIFSESVFSDEKFCISISRISYFKFCPIQYYFSIIKRREIIYYSIRSIHSPHDNQQKMDFKSIIQNWLVKRWEIYRMSQKSQSVNMNPFSWYVILKWFWMDMTHVYGEWMKTLYHKFFVVLCIYVSLYPSKHMCWISKSVGRNSVTAESGILCRNEDNYLSFSSITQMSLPDR